MIISLTWWLHIGVKFDMFTLKKSINIKNFGAVDNPLRALPFWHVHCVMLFVSNVICIQGMRSKTPVIKLVYWFAWTTLIFGDKVLSLGLRNTIFFYKVVKCVENVCKTHYHACFYNIPFLNAYFKINRVDF